MATVVCQGLQSCLDLQLVESRMLKLKLPSPKPHFSQSLELATRACVLDTTIPKELGEKCNHEELSHKANFLHEQQASSNRDSGTWSFLQALQNPSQDPKESSEKETTYVHPLVKRSLCKLSEKSLELCTENLGCETGSDISENSIFLSTPSVSATKEGNSPTREQHKTCRILEARIKKVNSCSFPPPLTTMSGSEFLHVRSHRENGRLIIKAIKSPSKPSCFQAERSNGRLQLHLVEDSSASSFNSTEQCEDNIFSEGSIKKENTENDLEYDKQAEEEREQVKEGIDENLEKDMDGSKFNGGDDMGMEEFIKPIRGKEGEIILDNNGLSYLKPFWVGTTQSCILDLFLLQ